MNTALITLVALLATNIKAAWALFETEVELKDAATLIKSLNASGQSDLAATLEAFVEAYNTETEPNFKAMLAPTSTKNKGSKGKSAPNKKPSGDRDEYKKHGKFNIFIKYRLKPFNADSGEELLFCIPQGTTGKAKANYIREMWFKSIAQAQADGDMKSKALPQAYHTHAYWLTRCARQQIRSCFEATKAKEYYTDDMPMPSHADGYSPKRKSAPKKK